jgi:hypothetical protein
MTVEKQMHMVGHYLQGYNLALQGFRLLLDKPPQVFLHRAGQHFAAPLRTPDKVAIDQEYRPQLVSVCMTHRP